MSTPQTPDAGPDPVVAVRPPVVVPTELALRPRRKSRRRWIILGAVLGTLLLLGAAAAVYVVLFVLDQRPEPEETVRDYDRAYDEVDCELYFGITTVAFQKTLAETCDDFEAIAQTFVDGFTDYDVEITGTTITDDVAEITTSESWTLRGQQNSTTYLYTLLFVDGVWRIDALE